MIRVLLFFALLIILNLFNSCSNERVARASKDGINIIVISKKGRHFVVIQLNRNFSGDFTNQNYIEVSIKGGIVPLNHLVLFKDHDSNRVLLGYSGDVINKKLDSTFVFCENDNDVCYDVRNFQSRKCTDFDLFYVVHGSYR